MAYVLVRQPSAIVVTGTVSPITTTFTTGNTPGNLILLCVALRAGASDTTTGVTDTIGNAYVKIAALACGANLGGEVIYFAASPCLGSGASNTLSLAWTTGVQVGVMIFALEYSGQKNVAPAGLVDVSNAANTAGTSVSYGLTTTQPGDLIITTGQRTSGGVNWSGLSGTDLSGVTNKFQEVMHVLNAPLGLNTVTSTVSITGMGSGSLALFAAPAAAGGATGWVNRQIQHVNKR